MGWVEDGKMERRNDGDMSGAIGKMTHFLGGFCGAIGRMTYFLGGLLWCHWEDDLLPGRASVGLHSRGTRPSHKSVVVRWIGAIIPIQVNS